jgi:hypothetical protein
MKLGARHKRRQALPGWIFAMAFGMAPAVWSAEIQLEGGRIDMAGRLEVPALIVGPGAVLRGSGRIEGTLAVAGIVSPGVSVADVGVLSIGGEVLFQAGSQYECYAASHTSLDRLQADGAVSGRCEVSMSRAPDAIPLHQVIIDGGATSGYALFGATPTNWTLASVPEGDLELTERTGDSDADSLPDWWEFDYFSSRTAADPYAHDDADAALNWEEWVAGTDPKDGGSVFRILSIAGQTPNDPVVTWSAVPGRTYAVYRASGDVSGPYGRIADGIAGESPAVSYTDVLPAGNLWSYYQVRIQP